jgi:hypothetical protein
MERRSFSRVFNRQVRCYQTHNRYEVLYNINENTDHRYRPTPVYNYREFTRPRGHRTINRDTLIPESKCKGKHNVLLIGDNHATNAAYLLQSNLNKDYVVSGFVKPGVQ